LTVTRTGGSDGFVGVSYATADGTATGGAACTAGVDYISQSGSLSFNNGETIKTFTIQACDDALFEGNEALSVTLSSPTGQATLGTPNPATVTIIENDTVPTFQFSSATYSNSDDLSGLVPASATITVTRTGATDNAVSVNYATSNGTATGGAACGTGSGVDYVSASGTLNFASGDTVKTFNITVCADSRFEGNETVNLALSGPTAPAVLGTPNTAVLTIIDNDTQPNIQFSSATYSVGENTAFVTITATRTGAVDNAVTADYATVVGGSATGGASCGGVADYVSTNGTLSFAAGVISQTFNVSICNDGVVEPDETINLALSNPTGGATLGSPSTAVATITNDDVACTVQSTSPVNGATFVSPDTSVTVSFSGAANVSTITTNTADTSCSGSVQVSSDSFATCVRMAGAPAASGGNTSFTVTPAARLASSTTFKIRVTTSAQDTNGNPLQSTFTQANGFTTADPASITFSSATYRSVEGTPEAAITVTRNGISSTAVSVDIATTDSTATAGTCGTGTADYEAVSTTLNFAPNESTKVVNVQICTDTFTESPAESFGIALSNASSGAVVGSLGSASVNIIDAATEFTNAVFMQAAAGEIVSSDVEVTGYALPALGMRVTLFGLSTTSADDLDVLLVSPSGKKYALVGDVGGSDNLNLVTLTLEDNGSAGAIPDNGPITEGVNYQPTNCESPFGDITGSPAGPVVEPGCGPTPANTMAETFGSDNPSGFWTLYLRNDAPVPLGSPNVSITGWGLQFIAPTAAEISVSGRVSTASGMPIRNAAVTVQGGDLAEPITVYTGSLGFYTIDGLHAGVTYILSVGAKRYRFDDAVRAVTPLESVAGLDFVARP
jgi:hypothetical protein